MRSEGRTSRPAARRRDPAPFELRLGAHGRGVFARRPIPAGTRLFGPDDRADAAERASFVDLPLDAALALPEPARAAFLRYAYNVAPELLRGTFHHEAVRHPSNFINHACAPNAGYDGGAADDIVTYRAVARGEELTMDYGACTFGFDHGFACRCGAPACRGRVRGEDWRMLARAGVPILGFMRPRIEVPWPVPASRAAMRMKRS